MLVNNVKIYGFEDSVRASKYPMAIDIEDVNDEITEGVVNRFKCDSNEGHDVALQGIIVQFDLTFSKQAWAEMERYHFVDFVSSQSTMHRITKFDISTQCNKYVDPLAISLVNAKIKAYNTDPTPENYLKVLYNVPSGFELTARLTTNYRQLKTIYKQRKNHRLPEWRKFCEWIENLPGFSAYCLR